MKIKIIGILLSTILIVTIIPIGVSTVTTSGDIITVDDDGGADYTRIQDAISIANSSDTIYVFSGIYEEQITIYETINLTGEDKETTIIDGGGSDRIIYIYGDGIN